MGLVLTGGGPPTYGLYGYVSLLAPLTLRQRIKLPFFSEIFLVDFRTFDEAK